MAERDIFKINEKHLVDGKTTKDKIYNWVVTKYTENDNEFGSSDKFIWKGTVYLVPQWIGYLIFIALFMWLANIGINRYGEARTIIFFMLLIMWRLNKLVSQTK